MNSKQTDAFFAVAQTGSFDLAATTLNITASAVTLRVQNLEKNLGHLLLVRDRPCRMTQAGQTLFNYLQHQKRLQHNLIQDLGGQDIENGFYQLNIASNADSLASWLLPTLQPVLLKHQITLHVQVDDQSRTHQLLEVGRVSACLKYRGKSDERLCGRATGSNALPSFSNARIYQQMVFKWLS